MLYSAYQHKGLSAVRYSRGAGVGAVEQEEMTIIPMGHGDIVKRGQQVAILSFGTLLPAAMQAATELDATLVNMRFVKPLDERLIRELSESHDLVVTLEENVIAGGAGSAVNEFVADQELNVACLNLGLPDQYLNHDNQAKQLAECGLDGAGIVNSISKSVYYQPIIQKKSESA
jgi:1-deoxy-D-xylulose-5-phosphate synthase